MTCCPSVSSKMKSQQILKPEDHRKTAVPSGHQHQDVTTSGPSQLLRRALLCSDKHACSHSHHAPRYGTSCGNTTNFHTSTEDTDGSLRSGPSAAEPLAGTDPTVHTAPQSHRRAAPSIGEWSPSDASIGTNTYPHGLTPRVHGGFGSPQPPFPFPCLSPFSAQGKSSHRFSTSSLIFHITPGQI